MKSLKIGEKKLCEFGKNAYLCNLETRERVV